MQLLDLDKQDGVPIQPVEPWPALLVTEIPAEIAKFASCLLSSPCQDIGHGVIPDGPENGTKQARHPPDVQIFETQVGHKYVDRGPDGTGKDKAQVALDHREARQAAIIVREPVVQYEVAGH